LGCERWEAPDTYSIFVRDRYVSQLRFAQVLTGDRHLAEDLVQDALERAGVSWRRIARRDDP
jgi:DNA-directed RNA polymerase specialized sigma24 family protein